LKNATYHAVLDEPVTLQDGKYEGPPYTAMSASRPVVTLVESTIVVGDVAGDEADDAIVMLATNTGGSGVFFHLAVVRNLDGTPQHIGMVPLGDRVKVQSLEVIDGRIVADLVEHGPGDPMCCPTAAVHREWALQDGKLEELDTRHKQPTERHRGHLTWGHETRTFTGCGTERTAWVINESGEDLVEVYEELTSAPYEPLFVEVSGNWADAPKEGFGADYPEAMRITEWHRAERESWGCDLDLEGVLFVATGNEPFWRVHIREDGISMWSMDSPGETKYSAPELSETDGRISFTATGADTGIRVMLEKQRCIDTMSGSRYEYVVTAELEGMRLSGCAIRGL
jgi:uncharacterized membrane protein